MGSAEPRFTPLAEWINDTRAQRGWSERELALRLGWSASKLRYYTISQDAPGRKWGGNSEVDPDDLRALADALGEPAARAVDAYYRSRGNLLGGSPALGVNQQIMVDETAALEEKYQRLVADVVIVLARGLRV